MCGRGGPRDGTQPHRAGKSVRLVCLQPFQNLSSAPAEHVGAAARESRCPLANPAAALCAMLSTSAPLRLLACALLGPIVYAGICNDKRTDCSNWARDGECSGENAVRDLRMRMRQPLPARLLIRVAPAFARVGCRRSTWRKCARSRAAPARTCATTPTLRAAAGRSRVSVRLTLMRCCASARPAAACARRSART